MAVASDTTHAPVRASHDRRGFLRGLATLPLIGGSVALIGQPSASAEPITDDLLAVYAEWLTNEQIELAVERHLYFGWNVENRPIYGTLAHDFHYPTRKAITRNGAQRCPEPSTRAALVLSTVGCDWRAA